MNITSKIEELESYAKEHNVPIMQKDGIKYIQKVIKENNIFKILELGTAIGYSAINFVSVSDNINLTSVERDEERYKEAVKNIYDVNYNGRVNLILGDALDIELTDKYDLIIIDAAKGQNINFFNKYKSNLKENGIIIFDNMDFHGLVGNREEIKSRNLRALVRKIEEFREFITNNEEFSVEFIEVGDGLAVCKRKDNF